MHSEITKINPNENKTTYPCLKVFDTKHPNDFDSGTYVVMFTAPSTGVIVHSDVKLNTNSGRYCPTVFITEVGTFCDHWTENHFIPFNDSITLRN